jgi:glycosyltransferase involved in cell wall biosynthesis
MICCDVPVLGLDIGALGERIRATGAGLVVDPADGAAGVERALVGLLADPERLASLRATSRPEGLAENAARYSALYRDLAGA